MTSTAAAEARIVRLLLSVEQQAAAGGRVVIPAADARLVSDALATLVGRLPSPPTERTYR